MKAEPALSSRIARMGEIFQLAYVPGDMEAAIRFWTQLMGAGPFFRRRALSFEHSLYRGAPSPIRFDVLIGYWGNLQIELIEQLNDAPSIYRDWTAAGQEGLQHVCIAVDDITAARAQSVDQGMEVVQEVYWPGGGAIYVDTGGGPGTMVEMVQLAPEGHARFAMYRDAARGWNGADPVRDI
ncbi:VOC family protein [Sandaracinobacter sp. RS1-74]|uniref:VOC family protein n=1 Tax=Sandaracinobacteroides sayramensis TaxID=2913411 RepID=UPI001EDBB3B5|nr:VOC family protein [Sandaracinobacteroides sayramensis]MCG2840546.1 VOC family protein [Sandaracinobacteroides sayramensis]